MNFMLQHPVHIFLRLTLCRYLSLVNCNVIGVKRNLYRSSWIGPNGKPKIPYTLNMAPGKGTIEVNISY